MYTTICCATASGSLLFLFILPAITVDNVFKVLEDVKWDTLCVGYMYTGGVLDLPNSMHQKLAKKKNRRRRAVDFWVSNHPYASWRLLITQLDQEEEYAVADKIRHYAETVTGTFYVIGIPYLLTYKPPLKNTSSPSF